MLIEQASADWEAIMLRSEGLLAAIGICHDKAVNAVIMLKAEGLHQSGRGAWVSVVVDSRNLIDGSFTDANELNAGFWPWSCKKNK